MNGFELKSSANSPQRRTLIKAAAATALMGLPAAGVMASTAPASVWLISGRVEASTARPLPGDSALAVQCRLSDGQIKQTFADADGRFMLILNAGDTPMARLQARSSQGLHEARLSLSPANAWQDEQGVWRASASLRLA